MTAHKTAAEISPLMRELASYIAGARRTALPKPAAEATKHHLLDTLAAMVSGSRLIPGKRAHMLARALGGSKEATVVGSRIVTNAINAALANGMQAHADETDDSHSRSLTHPGCANVSAALAVAERERRGGTELLRAVALGYDIATRMNIYLGASTFADLGHLSHGFGNTFGAAAASAALCRFNADQVRGVLAYAAEQASGISCFARDPEHVEKAFDFGGMPARNGVTAATMIKIGSSFVDDVFTGERNFFIAYDESHRLGRPYDPAILTHGLGQSYEVVSTAIKRWAVGSPIQAPLDSLLALMREHGVKADDVEKMVVRTYAGGARITNNREASDLNIQHMCALMLVDGYASFEATHDHERMMDPRILAVRSRIELIADEELEKLRPSRQGIIELTLKDGRRLRHHTKAVRGSVQNPMTRPEVDEKCYRLMAPVLGNGRARKLCDTVWEIERVKDVRKLRTLLRA